MLQLQAQLQVILDEAQGEELRDNGGGEHGGAQWIARVVQCHDPPTGSSRCSIAAERPERGPPMRGRSQALQ